MTPENIYCKPAQHTDNERIYIHTRYTYLFRSINQSGGPLPPHPFVRNIDTVTRHRAQNNSVIPQAEHVRQSPAPKSRQRAAQPAKTAPSSATTPLQNSDQLTPHGTEQNTSPPTKRSPCKTQSTGNDILSSLVYAQGSTSPAVPAPPVGGDASLPPSPLSRSSATVVCTKPSVGLQPGGVRETAAKNKNKIKTRSVARGLHVRSAFEQSPTGDMLHGGGARPPPPTPHRYVAVKISAPLLKT